MRKLFLYFFAIGFFFMLPFATGAHDSEDGSLSEGEVRISVFEREDCTHCQDLHAFFDAYRPELHDAHIVSVDIYTDDGRALFERFTDTFRISKVTPILLVGDTVLVGFDTSETTGKRIAELIELKKGHEQYTFQEYLDRFSIDGVSIDAQGSACPDGPEKCTGGPIIDTVDTVRVPILGAIDVKKYSLGAMAVILGFVDGFNPCAMWVLVMFLTFLLQAGSRRRMIQIAGLFILAETIMYYLIMTVWMTAWDFIGMDRIVTPIVGVVAVGAGCFFLYEFYKYRGTCKIVNTNQKQKIQGRIQRIVNSPLTLAGAFGVLGLAFSVNIIEFACSIGIPQAFTKILDLNMLSGVTRQLYIFLYILFYMVDDFIVFAGALWAFSKLNLATKYSQASNLIGGILMLLLGILLLFAPQVLIF